MKPTKTEYEYLLVGSGVAATMVISELLESDPSCSILVLEVGPEIKLRDRRSWWDLALGGAAPYQWTYDIETGQKQESASIGGTTWGFSQSRVRAYGGSTMHWGGWALRYKEEDFEAFTYSGRGADWPIRYADLEPWYAKAEQALSVSGSKRDVGPARTNDFPLPPFPWTANEAELAVAFEKHGLVPGHMPIARFQKCMTTGTCKYCPIGSRYTAQDHLDSLRQDERHSGLEVVTGATVTKLLASKDRIDGVQYMLQGEAALNVVTGKTVIVCGGAYESPKLLLRSTSADWPTGIGNRFDQVGRYIVTHSMLRVIGKISPNSDRWFQEYDFPTLMSRSWDILERQKEGKVFLYSNRTQPNTDLAALMISGMDRQSVDAALTSSRTAGLDAFIEEFGEYKNRVTNGTTTGQFGLPTTVVEYTRDPIAEETAKKVIQDMKNILLSMGYTITKEELQNPRGDHTTGTCRMGSDEKSSVTNRDLRVHGVENLYVCSNAVMPTAAAVNPTLTLAALSLKLGAHLADERNGGRAQ